MEAELEEAWGGVWSLLPWLASGVMVVGVAVPYIPQYQEIRRTGNTDGFSTRVCLVLLVANILRVFFWIGKQFELALLLQSVVMILTMMALLHLCCTVQSSNRVSIKQHRITGTNNQSPNSTTSPVLTTSYQTAPHHRYQQPVTKQHRITGTNNQLPNSTTSPVTKQHHITGTNNQLPNSTASPVPTTSYQTALHHRYQQPVTKQHRITGTNNQLPNSTASQVPTTSYQTAPHHRYQQPVTKRHRITGTNNQSCVSVKTPNSRVVGGQPSIQINSQQRLWDPSQEAICLERGTSGKKEPRKSNPRKSGCCEAAGTSHTGEFTRGLCSVAVVDSELSEAASSVVCGRSLECSQGAWLLWGQMGRGSAWNSPDQAGTLRGPSPYERRTLRSRSVHILHPIGKGWTALIQSANMTVVAWQVTVGPRKMNLCWHSDNVSLLIHSVSPVCVKMVVLWTAGDVFKTSYFAVNDSPVQFW
ncbi:hypothetical protein P4O66_018189, partial [Electrophorus voltai]